MTDTSTDYDREPLTINDKHRILEGYILRRFVLEIDSESTLPSPNIMPKLLAYAVRGQEVQSDEG